MSAILESVAQSVAEIPGLVEAGLAQKLGGGDGQVLGPIRSLVDMTATVITERLSSVRALLTDEIDPARSTSTLGRALIELRDLLDSERKDSVQGTLMEAVQRIAGEDGALARSVRATVSESIRPLADEVNRIGTQIALADAARTILNDTTAKGASYEEEVLGVLARPSASGTEVQHIGPDNRPGDVLVAFGTASTADGLRIVVEARDRTAPSGRKVIADTLSKAMAERGANAAIYVSRGREGLAAEVGEWAEGSSDCGPWIATTHDHLIVAVRFLVILHRFGTLRAESGVDSAAIDGQVDRIRTALRKISTIKRNVTTIRDSAGAIQEEAETLQFDIRGALLSIEGSIRSSANDTEAGSGSHR